MRAWVKRNNYVAVKEYLDCQKSKFLCSWMQIAVTYAGGSRKLVWMKEERSSETEKLLSLFSFQSECLTYCLLLSIVCPPLLSPKDPGRISNCVRLEMQCGMQRSGKKSRPLAYRPQSWHRLRLWASHNCLGTAVLFCWHVICLQQCADWACLSFVALILPLLCPVEHFCISVADHSNWFLVLSLFTKDRNRHKRFSWYHTNTQHIYTAQIPPWGVKIGSSDSFSLAPTCESLFCFHEVHVSTLSFRCGIIAQKSVTDAALPSKEMEYVACAAVLWVVSHIP